MKNFSSTTKAYILGTIFAGLLLSAWQLSRLEIKNIWILLALSVLACITHLLKVEGPTRRSNYQMSFMVYGFTLVIYGPPAVVLVIIVAHLVEWFRYRYPWFIQCFNVGSFVVTITLAGWVYSLFLIAAEPAGPFTAVAVLSAMIVFTMINHFMIGLVLKLARGESFADSEVFGRLPLMLDFSVFGLGAGAAFLWDYNPYTVVLMLIPLYLIYSTLQLPALVRRAESDPKTGLFNVNHFNNVLESELSRAHRFDRPLTVVMGDLDLLRNINNTYGHLAGDQVLIGVAEILKSSLRDYDVVARFGGEEFSILMPETYPEQALPRIEEIRAKIEAARFPVPNTTSVIQATISFGIAGRYKGTQKARDVIHAADLALLQGKFEGRNRVIMATRDGRYETIPPVNAYSQTST